MNVYDFDGIIFYPDCSVGFTVWCMNRHPTLWLTFFPKALKNLILYKKGKMSRTLMMRQFFSFLGKVGDFDRQIGCYWDKHKKKNGKGALDSCCRSVITPNSTAQAVRKPWTT